MLSGLIGLSLVITVQGFGYHVADGEDMYFNRIATFPVCEQEEGGCDTDTVTAAETISYHEDSKTVVYSDSELGVIGFVDLSDPTSPSGLGTIDVGGEPTTVVVHDDYAVIAVNTSPDFLNPSGVLHAIDISTQTVLRTWDLGGQPDSVAVSPDGAYLAIAIENERDEDLGDGTIPQLPAGFVVVVTLAENLDDWSTAVVEMTGLDGCYENSDPEPEYVYINSNNEAAVSLQENNCIAIIDLESATVKMSFDAGSEELESVDLTEDDIISQTESTSLKREPDGIAWIGTDYIVTANEGDMDGGGRSFTIYSAATGQVVYTSGNELEHLAASLGTYPEARSDAKGTEPENVAYAEYDGMPFLFVLLERASFIAVYDVTDPSAPVYKQSLPAQVGPEGVWTSPSSGLLLVASEVDERGNKIRSAVNIYQLQKSNPQYPTIKSMDRSDGTPIPFSALSGLGAGSGSILYSVEDSFYDKSRIFVIDTAYTPAQLYEEITIVDTDGVFASVSPYGDFTSDDLAALINDDNSINIDPEGIAKASLGGEDYFIIASEGRGTVGDESRPIESLNFIFLTDLSGVIKHVITLPDDVNDIQLRFGFEGVCVDSEVIYVAFQRVWGDETNVRIGMYDYATSTWSFVFYELDTPESPLGGWVGLSDIAPLGSQQFLILERDNQGGPDAVIKRVYQIDLSSVSDGDLVSKTFVADLKPIMDEATNALTFEKVEGLTVMEDGTRYIVNDNDGVDDNSGEIQLLTF
mmetsp:Transcript_21865/g.33658  ORF Transcript_21865/g.33658 Transcript_21865/m.33658 type:complete len:751 (-) Transcript_21865:252-2504(-)